jgi:S1-C subfamily serine protease
MLEDRYPNQSDEPETPTNSTDQSGSPAIPPAAPGPEQANQANARANNPQSNQTGQFRRPDFSTSQYPYWQEIYSNQASNPNRTQVNPYQSPADGGYTPPPAPASGMTNPYQSPAAAGTATNPYRSPLAAANPYQTAPGPAGYRPDYRATPVSAPPAPARKPAQEKRKSNLGLLAAINGIFLIAIVALVVVFLLNERQPAATTPPPQAAAAVAAAPTSTATPANPTAAATNNAAPPANANVNTAVTTVSAPAATSGTQLSVRQVTEMVKPAVVQVSNLQKATNPFGARAGRQGSNGSTGTDPVEAGVGSGIIYDKAGYILTNHHVVDGADALLVTLPDGRAFPATIVGQDMMTDLAVIKVDSKGADLPVAVLGDSNSLHVGDGLVAIGNALALPGGPTVTSGVVSALDRSVAEPSSQGANGAATAGPTLYGLIQTDAAINPGNSGGPLVDLQGQVVGINTLGAGQAEPGVQAQGIGFAISINQAKQIAQELVANGKVSHAFLGISYQPLTPAIATQLGVTLKEGAVLMTVEPGTPADQAGLKAGDIITSIDGKQLVGESALGQILNGHKPGDKITLQVVTPTSTGGNGQPHDVQVTLGERPAGQ